MCKKIVEDDPLSYAFEAKLEKRHLRWYQCYDNTLGEGLTNKKVTDPRRWSVPAKLTSERKQGLHSTEGSTREAGDPRSKMEFARDSLGPFPLFI